MWLLAYRSVQCHVAGSSASSTTGYVGARSDTTSLGAALVVPSACSLQEEPVGVLGVPARGDEHVDDLPELVDRAVHVAPSAGDLHIGLVDLPAVTDGVPARPGGVGQQRREPLHPAVDRDVVDLDPALGEELLEIAEQQSGESGGFSCRQLRCSDAVTANATAPPDPRESRTGQGPKRTS